MSGTASEHCHTPSSTAETPLPIFAHALGGVALRSQQAELNTPRISVRFFMSLNFFGRQYTKNSDGTDIVLFFERNHPQYLYTNSGQSKAFISLHGCKTLLWARNPQQLTEFSNDTMISILYFSLLGNAAICGELLQTRMSSLYMKYSVTAVGRMMYWYTLVEVTLYMKYSVTAVGRVMCWYTWVEM